jgi:hypothetical protein
MEKNQKVVRRIRIDQKTIDVCRDYFPGYTLQKLIENSLKNEIRRRQKKRLRNPF